MKKTAKIVKGISQGLDVFTRMCSVPIMGLFLLLIFVGVLSRFVFNVPILATDELCRIGFVWVCFFGAADAFKTKTNIAFMMVLSKVSDRVRHIMYIGIHSISIIFFAVMGYYGIGITLELYENLYAITGFTMSAAYVAIPVTMLIMIIHGLNFIFEEIELLKEEKGGGIA